MHEPGNIKIGIDAPRGVGVDREEIYKQKQINALQDKTQPVFKNQSIFQLLLSVTDSVQMLEQSAKQLFDKDKNISITTIRNIADGRKPPSAWTVSCAIHILIHEKTSLVKELLSTDDFCRIWARPLLKAGITNDEVFTTAQLLNISELTDFINNPIL